MLTSYATRIDFAESVGALDRMREAQSMTLRAGLRRMAFRRAEAPMQLLGITRHLHGREVRNPLANRQLLEFCLGIPDEQYLRGGVDRFLARRVLADRLPAEVIGHRGQGFQCAEFFHRMIPMRDAMASGIEELERSPLATRILDVPRMKRLLTDWPAEADKAGIEYLSVLHRGLQYGQFLRWIEGGN